MNWINFSPPPDDAREALSQPCSDTGRLGVRSRVRLVFVMPMMIKSGNKSRNRRTMAWAEEKSLSASKTYSTALRLNVAQVVSGTDTQIFLSSLRILE